MDLQKLVDSMSDIDRQTRARYHLTLGQAISRLNLFNKTLRVVFDWSRLAPCNPDSYRGYYSDLALAECEKHITVHDFSEMLKECLDKSFYGYKGGDFIMDKDTPLWAAEYGSSGRAIMRLEKRDESVLILTKYLD